MYCDIYTRLARYKMRSYRFLRFFNVKTGSLSRSPRSSVVEPAVPEEMCDLPHHQRISHDKRVGVGDDDEVAHLREHGALHRNHAVVRSVHESREHEIDAQVARDHTDVDPNRLQAIDHGLRSPADLLTGRAGDPSVERYLHEQIDEFAPLVRRGKHDEPAACRHGISLQVLTDDEAAQGMTDEMDLSRFLRFTDLYGARKMRFGDRLDRFGC